MSFLICRFASPRSRPEQIRDWIDYLGGLRTRHGSDPERARLIERMETQAERWLQAALGRGGTEAQASSMLAGFTGD